MRLLRPAAGRGCLRFAAAPPSQEGAAAGEPGPLSTLSTHSRVLMLFGALLTGISSLLALNNTPPPALPPLPRPNVCRCRSGPYPGAREPPGESHQPRHVPLTLLLVTGGLLQPCAQPRCAVRVCACPLQGGGRAEATPPPPAALPEGLTSSSAAVSSCRASGLSLLSCWPVSLLRAGAHAPLGPNAQGQKRQKEGPPGQSTPGTLPLPDSASASPSLQPVAQRPRVQAPPGVAAAPPPTPQLTVEEVGLWG